MGGSDKKLIRIIDANFNRAKEGLRVCEDVCRYAWDRTSETKVLKKIRHDLSSAIEPVGVSKLLESRDVHGDVGRPSSKSE
ncbi:MAG: thiamine-phosphate pyrophosphorylase, partial [Candidatus Omnitrophica bacterium]|nr:thiamine-phosphate pyrophosphorylase [Candidatus Omnitrophota bacterium]